MESFQDKIKFKKVGKGVIKSNKYTKICKSCGRVQVYSSQSSLANAKKADTICNSCSSRSNARKGKLYKELVPIGWYAQVQGKAKRRKILFDISLEYIYQLFKKQGEVCALSGIPLFFGIYHKGNVSIDRIDSNKPYVEGNIQLVHKEINFSKWSLTQARYIELCKLVAKRHNC